MDFWNEFVSNYGMTILYAIFTSIAGYIGLVVKNLYKKYVDDDTKKSVVKTCVLAVEQLYKDIHGDDKLQKALEAASKILAEKNISISDTELRMLIEASVSEFNDSFSGSASEDTPAISEC